MKNKYLLTENNSVPETINVYGAREHNLKNINLSFPREKLVVITGVSGSGKSSIAFDTIYAEGQRRYIESFASYARNFIGNISRPEVDRIEGLSPVISIEQKTTSRNSRSTVGTSTEIYDFLRLLYSKISDAYSPISNKKMIKQTEEELFGHIYTRYKSKKITILAPIIKQRKGQYKELFNSLLNKGFSKVRVDGEIHSLMKDINLDRYKTHNIELLIDRLEVIDDEMIRLKNSINLAIEKGEGAILVIENHNEKLYSTKLMDIDNGVSLEDPAPNFFSFNSPKGACTRCNGLGVEVIVENDNFIDHTLGSIRNGALIPLGPFKNNWTFAIIGSILKEYDLSIDTLTEEIPEEAMNKILYGAIDPLHVEYRGQFWNSQYDGIIANLKKKVLKKDRKSDPSQEFIQKKICSECHGTRLKKETQQFKINDKSISDLSSMDISNLYTWLENLEDKLEPKNRIIATDPLKEIRKRLKLIIEIGLNYLTLNRPINTLSGGETQRIRLATQIGTQLIGILYILDEPSIGLHQRDNIKLIQALKDLRDHGNSILVVEHDKDIMLESDYIIDIGPGPGKYGGTVVAQGNPTEFLQKNSTTAEFLKGTQNIEVPEERRKGNGKSIKIFGCKGHNLKNVNLTLPLGTLTCITGVSGSGKSTLIHETLFKILNKKIYRSTNEPLPYDSYEGVENIDKIVEVNQSPIGRTPRSNPMTYTGVFALIRSLFTNLPEAKIRGYKPGRFSFNVKGGRCEDCEGAGIKVLEMDFLPSVKIPCESCRGKRYNRETLEVKYRGKSISDILDMTVDQGVDFFVKYPKILKIIQTLKEVGLGYITLGQHATTLSGGEAQRVKLATELSKRDTGKTLYILDEPTTGLHFQDIKQLISVLKKLADKGNTVLVIEHNLDIIKIADYIIDIGPEGGINGGNIIAEGTPEQIAQLDIGHTAKFLKKELGL